MRRFVLPLCVALTVLPALAQNRPADLQPLPEPPPPPPGMEVDGDVPQVTITKRGEDRVEEYRVNGRLYMQKVTPPTGTSYYLVDDHGDDHWARQDLPDGSFRPPMWVIGTF